MTDTTAPAVDHSASDDFAAFEQSLINPGPAPDLPQTAEPEPQALAEDAGAQDDPKVEGEPPKAKKTAQERINELTWRANEAERRERAAQERYEAALAGKTTPAPEPQGRSEKEPPNPADYEFGETDANYISDLVDHKVQTSLAAHAEAQEARTGVQTQLQSFNQRKDAAFTAGVPEGWTKFEAVASVPAALTDIMLRSEVGPQLGAHFGDNPAELDRLSAMPLHLQAYEIAKVEARLTPSAEPVKPSAKVITTAPDPAPQMRGAGGTFKASPDTSDFKAFENTYGRK